MAEDFLVASSLSIFRAGSFTLQEDNAGGLLVREIQQRCRVKPEASDSWSNSTDATVILGTVGGMGGVLPEPVAKLAPTPGGQREGFAIAVEKYDGRILLFVIGQDSRGLLFGIGYLLRQLCFEPEQIRFSKDLEIATAPHAPLRGHQLGYRPKTNSYDAWDVAQWHQYICDLAIFGANAIELVPPRSDDEAWSPHFPLPQLEMMREMSAITDAYGLDCWIWFPALDANYTDPAIRDAALAEWEEIFRTLPRIDVVFVPGGDPGRTLPGVLMDFLELQAASLRRHHPKAEMWMSPQGFNAPQLEEWLEMMKAEPAWLQGIVYGPWTRLSLPELRKRVPQKYPLRLYPDIAHNYLCQFPVSEWDTALASTLGREPVNPRPMTMAGIIRSQIKYAVGVISYSEGCNDDVNKTIWSALTWDPTAEVSTVLEEYSRYFIGADLAVDFAEGILALEKNWEGSLAQNSTVKTTLEKFQAMEGRVLPAMLRNWRFVQGLYRAYFDAYAQTRLLKETQDEEAAMELLQKTAESGPAMELAEERLFSDRQSVELQSLRTRIFQLGEALFQTIGMQLSVPMYKATTTPRGANLDTVDLPLNNRIWLRNRFAEIRQLPDEQARRAELKKIVDWTDPGEGGFYDDLGNLAKPSRRVFKDSVKDDPEYRNHALLTHTIRTGSEFEDWRASWLKHVTAFYESTVQLRYDSLEPGTAYRIRLVYVPSFMPSDIKLVALGFGEIHGWMSPGVESAKELPIVREFEIPAAAIREGGLTLEWSVNPNAGELAGFGQIAEVWLIKK